MAQGHTQKTGIQKIATYWAIRVLIRDFRLADKDRIVEILKLNDQYGFPEVDGPEAMNRVKACSAAVFLVCEIDDMVVGVVRGNYDGSRAMIHQLSVHPTYQRRGIGTALVKGIVNRFQQMGAPTVSATIIEKSLPFWQKLGFRKTKAFIAGNWQKQLEIGLWTNLTSNKGEEQD